MWLQDLQALAEHNHDFEAPERHRALVQAALAAHPDITVGEFRVEHLDRLAASLASKGIVIESARQLATFPPSTPVIDALRILHQRFGN